MVKKQSFQDFAIYLDVPYEEKDEAKALGAKWHVSKKKWYFTCGYTDKYHKDLPEENAKKLMKNWPLFD